MDLLNMRINLKLIENIEILQKFYYIFDKLDNYLEKDSYLKK